MRRALAAVLVVVLGGACAGPSGSSAAGSGPGRGSKTIQSGEPVAKATPTTAAPTTTTRPPGAVAVGTLDLPGAPVADRPLVINDAGNSILFDAEPALSAALGEIPFRPHTIGGFGVSVDPEVWQGVFGRDVPADGAAVTVVMLGNRDFAAAVADPDTYRGQLDEAVRLMTAGGTRVLWLGLPPLPPSPDDELGRRTVNALFAELPDRFPGLVRYVPTDDVLTGTSGVWVRSLAGSPDPVRKLKPDGSPEQHLCPGGAILLAGLVRREVAPFVALPSAPTGWEQGPWRGDRRYDDPPGACRP